MRLGQDIMRLGEDIMRLGEDIMRLGETPSITERDQAYIVVIE